MAMGNGSAVSHIHVCPNHPFQCILGRHRFSLRHTDDFVIVDIHCSIFGCWVRTFSIGFRRCRE